MVDISTRNIGFLGNLRLEKGATVSLVFRLPGCWRRIAARGRVIRQVGHAGKDRAFDYLTGVLFVGTPESSVKRIGRFVGRSTRLTPGRWAVLFLGTVVSSAFLARAIYYGIMDMLRQAAFGREMLGPRWSALPLKLIGAAHVAFAFWLLVSCAAFFCMKKWARLSVMACALMGLSFQGFRVAMKIPLIEGGFMSAIPLFEGLFCAACAKLALLAFRAGNRIEAVGAHLEEQLRFQEGKGHRIPPAREGGEVTG